MNTAISAKLSGGSVLVPDERDSNVLYQRSFFGEMQSGGRLSLSLVEALYLVERGKIKVSDKGRPLTFETLLKRLEEIIPDIYVQLVAYRDLRDRGYIVKTGFKFGAHFRVYERGKVPGPDHSAFIVHAVPESYLLTMTELSRLVRLGHTVRKNMWFAVVDSEGDLTYYQLERIKP